MTLGLRWGGATDIGRVRAVNQDGYLITERLFAVADGMGGHAAGEVASQVALETLRARYGDPTVDALVDAVRAANEAVLDRSASDPELRGMGTTLCVIGVIAPSPTGAEAGSDGALALANVGDSRIYLFRDGELGQISRDHKLVQDLVDTGQLSASEAQDHPQRNILTRALGIDSDPGVDEWVVEPFAGDRFLLCSDGLYDEVDDPAIASVLRRLADPQEAAEELVRLANNAGGRDNITVVVVDVVDDGGRVEEATAALAAQPGDGGGSRRPVGGGQADRSGQEPPVARTGTDTGPPPAAPAAERRETAPAVEVEKPRRFTWRVALFVTAVIGVFALAAGLVTWYARSAYFVGFEGDRVAIFQGRPGGVLWLDPTLEELTDLRRDDVPPARVDDVVAGKEEPSRTEARRYVDNLRDEAARIQRLEDRQASDDGPPGETATTTSTVPPGG